MKRHFFLCALSLMLFVTGKAQVRPSISILGDSYSTFENYLKPDTNAIWYFAKEDLKKTDVNRVEQTWWHKLISENGYKLCQNNSFSGATINYLGYRNEDYKMRSFITRLDNLGNPDIILIFGATNDSWCGAPIGEYKYKDWTEQELYTFRPAMACLLERAKLRYPNVEIYFILNSELKPEINESCKTICQHYGIDLIELKDISKQNGHPNISGMAAIAQQVGDYLKQKHQQH